MDKHGTLVLLLLSLVRASIGILEMGDVHSGGIDNVYRFTFLNFTLLNAHTTFKEDVAGIPAGGSPDMYATVHLVRKASRLMPNDVNSLYLFQTDRVDNTNYAVWNQGWQGTRFREPPEVVGTDCFIRIEVYDHNSVLPPEWMGTCNLPLRSVVIKRRPGGIQQCTFPMRGRHRTTIEYIVWWQMDIPPKMIYRSEDPRVRQGLVSQTSEGSARALGMEEEDEEDQDYIFFV